MLNTVLLIISIVAILFSVACCVACFACFSKYAKQTMRELNKISQGSPCDKTGKPKAELELCLYHIVKDALLAASGDMVQKVQVQLKLDEDQLPIPVEVFNPEEKETPPLKDPDCGIDIPEFLRNDSPSEE